MPLPSSNNMCVRYLRHSSDKVPRSRKRVPITGMIKNTTSLAQNLVHWIIHSQEYCCATFQEGTSPGLSRDGESWINLLKRVETTLMTHQTETSSNPPPVPLRASSLVQWVRQWWQCGHPSAIWDVWGIGFTTFFRLVYQWVTQVMNQASFTILSCAA